MSKFWKVGSSTVGWLLVLANIASSGGPSSQLPLLQSAEERSAGKKATQGGATTLSYPEDEILVQFNPKQAQSAMASAHVQMGTTVAREFSIVEGLQLVKLPPGLSVKAALAHYQALPDVEFAEPNVRVRILRTPNDPSFSSLWGLSNTGQAGGTQGADVDAPVAWDASQGNSNVVVAVIDTGLDYTHPDLAANMWRNTADCNHNGIDDDRNGYIDDCHGPDVVNGDADPMDDNGHGTHVAGIVGAVGNNGVGVVGVNWQVRLMACKFLDADGYGVAADAIACLQYVQTMHERGVNVVATNNSWGGGEYSQALRNAIAAQQRRGILFIAAAGNDASDNDTTPFYPGGYGLPNVIAVAATDRFDHLGSFSNYGAHTVHLGAPGHEILSTLPHNAYDVFSGTSMATPHVTGVAALLKAYAPGRDWRAIKNLILAGGDTLPATEQTVTGKRLNVQGALACANASVLSRVQPAGHTVSAAVGAPVTLSALHINCATPNGPVSVTVNPGNRRVTLLDNGAGADQAAGDGVYTGQWLPAAAGTYTLTFPGGDVVTVAALANYHFTATPFAWRTITGTNLNLDDDSSTLIRAPFPLLFGGGSYTSVFVSSNGTLNFSDAVDQFVNTPIPTSTSGTFVAPFWDDLYPVAQTDQNVFMAVIGTVPQRELVIEWRDVPLCCSADNVATITFQVVFFEGRSDILFNYADTIFGGEAASADRGATATVGVQVMADLGSQFSFNTPSLENQTALLWTTSSSAVTSYKRWQYFPFPSQSGTFTATFAAMPHQDRMNGVTGLALGPALRVTDVAVIVRFNPAGFLDVRNLDAYMADTQIAYTAGTRYYLRLEVDTAGQTYDVYVRPEGGVEQTLATGYVFRTEQQGIPSLNSWALKAWTGNHSVENFTLR